jgi:perosamine synthetase
MCLTNNKELADRMRLLRNHGMSPTKKYWHDEVGFNYLMTALQAAVGLAQLGKLDKVIEKKRQIAEWYKKGLEGLKLSLPFEMPWARNVYWLYTVLLEDDFGMTRDELMERLEKEGIETRPMFYPIHTMPPYKTGERFPIAEELSEWGISLPSGATLKREDVDRVIQSINNIAGGKK